METIFLVLSPFSWLPNHVCLRALRNNSKIKLVTKKNAKISAAILTLAWRTLYGDSWANKLRPQPAHC